MADIAMCSGEGCTLKETCHRVSAKPCEYMQSYFAIPPYKSEDENGRSICDMYWEQEELTKNK